MSALPESGHSGRSIYLPYFGLIFGNQFFTQFAKVRSEGVTQILDCELVHWKLKRFIYNRSTPKP